MNHLVCFAILLAVFNNVHSFEITSSRQYYSSKNDQVQLSCGNTVWDKNNFVTFYMDDLLIFNSGSNDKFPYISSTKDSRSVILNNQLTKGWKNLYCIANSIISTNTLTIPEVVVPTFIHTPDHFAINTSYRVTCDGAVNPSADLTYRFMFNDRRIASIKDGRLSGGNAPGIGITLGSQTRNSFEMTPRSETNYGKYYCYLDFEVSEGVRVNVSSNSWVTVKPKSDLSRRKRATSNVVDFKLQTSRTVCSKQFPDVKLECNSSAWNEDTVIVFYSGKTVIFDSSSDKHFPEVLLTSNNKTVLLVDSQTGWIDLTCSINGKFAVNTLTIPFKGEVSLKHSPEDFVLGQTYTLSCDGYVLPEAPLTVRFTYYDKTVAVVTGNHLTKGEIAGLEIENGVTGNNTIKFKPTLEANAGNYACQLEFKLDNAIVNVVGSAAWEASLGDKTTPKPGSGATSLMTSLCLLILSFSLIQLF